MRHRGVVLRGLGAALVLLAWSGVAVVGAPVSERLTSVQTNDTASFLPDDAEATRAAAVHEQLVGDQGMPGVLVVDRPGGLRDTDLPAAAALAAALPAAEVHGLAEGASVADYLVDARPVPVLPSPDGAAVLLPLALDEDAVMEPTADGEVPLRAVTAAVREAAADATGGGGLDGASAHLTGPAGLIADLTTTFGDTDAVLLVVTVGAVMVLLVLVYRSPLLPVAVLLTAVLALLLAGLVVFVLADRGALVLNGQGQSILLILVVGAATDYGLLLVSRYREELAAHRSAPAALWRAWRGVLLPVLASAGTVVAAMSCLLLASLGSNRSLGPVASIGVVTAVLAALTLLPCLLLAGRWLFWPRVPRPSPLGPGPAAAGAAVGGGGLWAAVAALVGRRPRRTWLVAAAALVVCAAFAPALRAEGTGQSEVFLTGVDSVRGQEVLAEHYPAGTGQPVLVVVPVEESEPARAVVGAAEGVGSVEVGPAGGGWAEVLATLDAGPGSEPAAAAVRALRGDLSAAGLHALVGGSTATSVDARDAAERDRSVVIPAVLAVVVVALVLLLRSIVAGLLLVAVNVLSYGAAVGVGAVVFHLLDLPGGDPAVPLYAFLFLVALGIDYSIFLMTRVREESVVHGTRAGTLIGLRTTGGVITSVGVVLATTFAALSVVPLLFLVQIALIVTVGILLDTVVVRSLVVPGLVHDIGDRTWWPSALWRGRRAAPVTGGVLVAPRRRHAAVR